MSETHALLPGPASHFWEWRLRGACRGADPGIFYPPSGERGVRRAERVDAAKRVCQGCPVLGDCLRHALTVHEPYGVWGGLSVGEREDLIRATR